MKNLDDKRCHIFVSRFWTRYSEHKAQGGSHIFNIKDNGNDGRIVYINRADKEKLIWYLNRSKIMRFLSTIYASSAFVPPFFWKFTPSIDSIESEITDEILYEYFKLTEDEIKIIEGTLS